MPERSTLWFDVTTLREWSGRPAVGIIRTEREIARRFLEQWPAYVRFCRFDRPSSSFVEIGHDEVWTFLRPPPPSPPLAPAAPSAPDFKRRAKLWVLRMVERLPPRWRGPVRAQLLRLRPHVVRWYLRLAAVRAPKPVAALPASTSRAKSVQFRAEDVYISMGLDWDHKDLAWLYRQKRDQGFGVVLLCYDLIPYKFPQLFSGDVSALFARYFVDLGWCADHVFCISEHTRKDFLGFLDQSNHGNRPETAVIHLGCEIEKPDERQLGQAVHDVVARPFILFVSTIERRKNHETVYRAYTRLVEEGVQDLPVLVFVGMRGWGVDDLMKDLALDPRVQGLIRVLDRVNDDELSALYEYALFTVYPSLYEGWGLPVAESLAHGKFCVASNASSVPEVGGDLVVYLDPWDVPGWARTLRDLFSRPEEIARLNARVKESYRRPTWDAAARQVFEAARGLRSRQQAVDRQPVADLDTPG